MQQAYIQLKALWDESAKGKSRSGTRLLHLKSDITPSASNSAVDLSVEFPERPPRLDWAPATCDSTEIGSNHRKSLSLSSSPHSFSEGINRLIQDDPISTIGEKLPIVKHAEKRNSWWTHRKSASDGEDLPLYNDEAQITESKTELFKSFFAVPQNEKLLSSMTNSFYLTHSYSLFCIFYESIAFDWKTICFNELCLLQVDPCWI